MGENVSAEPIAVQMFGAFQAQRGGLTVSSLRLREGERLLAYLILHSHEPVTSKELAQRFWPFEAQSNPGEQGDYPNVRQGLHSLRQALGTDAERLIRPYRGAVRLDVSGLDIDVCLFDSLVRVEGEGALAAYAKAVALYRGPLLAGWNDPWVVGLRKRRQREYETLLRELGKGAAQQGQHEAAIHWTRLLADARPDDPETQRELARLRETARATQPVAGAVTAPKLTIEVAVEAETLTLDAAGGAVPLLSHFYIPREADRHFSEALARRDPIVLLKGTRQVGKTSLLARGIHAVRQTPVRVVVTDFQKMNAAEFASPDALYRALAASLALQAGVAVSPRDVWDEDFGPNLNFERFLGLHLLPTFAEPAVWVMDEADRLLACPFGSEIFGLFRSWYNERSLNPHSVLNRLSLVISYATEAHLFITDLNQSPFNVGTRLLLSDFSLAQVAELNERYRTPLAPDECAALQDLVGGQPYLSRRVLDQVTEGVAFARVLSEAGAEEGIFGDHLRRLWLSVSRSPQLLAVLRGLLAGQSPTPDDFFRLRASGILGGSASQNAVFRCRLYESFFARQLAQTPPNP